MYVYTGQPPQQEFMRIAEELNGRQNRLALNILHAAPERPRDGDIVYADGTDWNPTSGGEGFYGYENGAWVKL